LRKGFFLGWALQPGKKVPLIPNFKSGEGENLEGFLKKRETFFLVGFSLNWIGGLEKYFFSPFTEKFIPGSLNPITSG